jgi:hypothetical protein
MIEIEIDGIGTVEVDAAFADLQIRAYMIKQKLTLDQYREYYESD